MASSDAQAAAKEGAAAGAMSEAVIGIRGDCSASRRICMQSKGANSVIDSKRRAAKVP